MIFLFFFSHFVFTFTEDGQDQGMLFPTPCRLLQKKRKKWKPFCWSRKDTVESCCIYCTNTRLVPSVAKDTSKYVIIPQARADSYQNVSCLCSILAVYIAVQQYSSSVITCKLMVYSKSTGFKKGHVTDVSTYGVWNVLQIFYITKCHWGNATNISMSNDGILIN